MSTYRLYVSTRKKMEGTDTDFTFELPYSITVKEKSLAMIDVVCVANRMLTVTEAINDTIWVRDSRRFEETFIDLPKLCLRTTLRKHCGEQSKMR